jgi:hypothetical protein
MHGWEVGLPAAASEVAEESAAKGLATANAAITAAVERSADRQTQKANENSPALRRPVSAANVRPAVAGPPATVPGWGCGDQKNTHTGPPGKPETSPPPGCKR